MTVIVYGASGFIGAEVLRAAQSRGLDARSEAAARLQTPLRDVTQLAALACNIADDLAAEALSGPHTVINAAGLAQPEAGQTDDLVGANALWPGVLVALAARCGWQRVVHISSAGVHGRSAVLAEDAIPVPSSHYGATKLLGEQVAREIATSSGTELVIYRPTSVQGTGRALTRKIRAFARSPLASVPGDGSAPTPQCLVENVAQAALYLALSDQLPTHPVLHPWEGQSVKSVLEHLGGATPRSVPRSVAGTILRVAHAGGRLHPWVDAQARRLEMLWTGQQQRPGWLDRSDYRPVRAWSDVAEERAAERPSMAYVTQWYAPEPFQHPEWIVRGMQAIGWDVSVLTGVPNYPTGVVMPGYRASRVQKEELRGAHLLRTPLYPSHDSSALGRALNYLSWAVSSSLFGIGLLRRVDAVYLYASPATAALPTMVARLATGRRFVLSVQDVWPDSVFASGFLRSGPVRALAERALTVFVDASYRLASHITVISPGMKDLLIARGVPEDKVTVVWNWTDEDVFTPSEPNPTLRSDLGLKPDDFCVFYAGNHGSAQNLTTLIDAIGLIPEAAGCHAVLVGDGMEKQSLMAHAEAVAPGRVHFLDARPAAQIPGAMAACDIGLVILADDPLFEITMPSKVQSIMASGEPVLVCAPGDAAAVVKRAEAGISARAGSAADLASAILRARDAGEDCRRTWGDNARAYYLQHMSTAIGTATVDRLLRSTSSRLRTAPDRAPAQNEEAHG